MILIIHKQKYPLETTPYSYCCSSLSTGISRAFISASFMRSSNVFSSAIIRFSISLPLHTDSNSDSGLGGSSVITEADVFINIRSK